MNQSWNFTIFIHWLFTDNWIERAKAKKIPGMLQNYVEAKLLNAESNLFLQKWSLLQILCLLYCWLYAILSYNFLKSMWLLGESRYVCSSGLFVSHWIKIHSGTSQNFWPAKQVGQCVGLMTGQSGSRKQAVPLKVYLKSILHW